MTSTCGGSRGRLLLSPGSATMVSRHKLRAKREILIRDGSVGLEYASSLSALMDKL